MAESAKTALGQILRSARSAKGLSLRAVEERTSVSNAYVSQLESGKIKQPSPTVLHELADLYEIPYSTLMASAGYPTPQGVKPDSAAQRMSARFGAISPEEEEELSAYLKFLRERERKRR